MFRRILFSSIAAASIVAATPALANHPTKDVDTGGVPPCCEGMAKQMHEHHGRAEATEKKDAAPTRNEQKTTQQTEEDDPFVRNQSWGG